MNLTFRHEQMSDLFDKYHIEGLPFPAVIHHFKGPEPLDAQPHDHPFDFDSFIMSGGYTERQYFFDKAGNATPLEILRFPGTAHSVGAETVHLITDVPDEGCFTLMLPGEKVREPGFWKFDETGAHFRQHDQPEFE